MKISKPKKSNKKFLIVTAIVALVLFGWGVYAYTQEVWPFTSESNDTSENASQQSEDSDINYDPPTEHDIKESQTAKERILDGDNQETEATEPPTNSSDNPSTKKRVAINVSYADIFENNLEIRAFTPNVIQGQGTCTATVSKSGSSTITRTSPAFIDATSTICEPIFIPKSQLASGTWNVEVKFSSPTHQGSSGRIEVEV